MNKIGNKPRGFSLLEMLLVIAVLAVISIAGISYLRDKALNLKIDKTALQIQQWLEASLAYQLDNGKPPKTVGDLLPADCSNPSGTYYMPCGSQFSPWYNNTAAGEYVLYNPQDEKRLTVKLTLPDNVADGHAAEVAKRIAGKLPIADVSGTTMTASFTPGAGQGQAAGIQILKIIPGIFVNGAAKVKSDPTQAGFDLSFEEYMDKLKRQNLCAKPKMIRKYVHLTAFQGPEVYLRKWGTATGTIMNLVINQDPDTANASLKIDIEMGEDQKLVPETVNNGAFIATITCEPK